MEERKRINVKPDSNDGETATGQQDGPDGPDEPDEPDEPETGSKAADCDADQTDVCSETFDPVLALYSPSVRLPFPNVRCFNNVSEYESFLKGGRGRAKPENVEKRRLKAMKGVADPARIERLKKLVVNNPVTPEGESSGTPRRRRKSQKNVLTRMSLCKDSPLGELHRCVQERIRVKVHIRTFKGLRGVCSGFVVAFDKFWNMAMVDVDETYREPLLGEALYHEKALTVTRLFEKLKIQESSAGDEHGARETARKRQPARDTGRRGHGGTGSEREEHKASPKARGPEVCQRKGTQAYGRVHTRHVKQLFIRGENIVLVNPQPL
ncbi:U7 snRNA-associated Sm-like protein LSm11 [Brachionichthys hirsutus]|uniref:U7 snRNA-associated Sm-like protein LSm11 n=1 Tax=Brachionichthys hirsutus TaxID=412623 RepID=UPI00360447FA